MTYGKPLPMVDADSKPFWDSCREQAAKLQRCSNCQRYRFPASSHCSACLSDRFAWLPISGRGRVYTAITIYQTPAKGWEQDVPFNASIVELEEGPRMWTNVIGCGPEEVGIGMPVVITYDAVTDEVTLPKFRPA